MTKLRAATLARCLLRPLALLALVLLCPGVRAAGPEPYTVVLRATGDPSLDQALTASSTLVGLEKAPPVGPFALIGRARNDETRFRTVLESFGYYDPEVRILIAGHPPDNPALPQLLAGRTAHAPLAITVSFRPGPLFHLGRVKIVGEIPDAARAAFRLAPGQPARAADVLAAGTRLLDALRAEGYGLAKVSEPLAILRPVSRTLDITFHVDTGPRVDLGPISISGLKTVRESFIRRRLTIHPGEQFSPAALTAARTNLAELPIFSSVSIRPATSVDAEGRLPITVLLSERKLHVVSFGASYSTDLGVGLTASWEDRNLFGNAEDLKLSAGTMLGGTANTRPGYEVNANFTKPDFLARNQSLIATLGTVDQNLDPYSRTALEAGIALSRPLYPHLTASFGLAAERERVTQNDITNNFTVIGLPLRLAYDNTNSLLDPTKGFRATLQLVPTASFGPPSADFLLAEFSASSYLDFSALAGEKPGRSILAVRGLVASVSGTSLQNLPADKRLYAGGSATVRGYRYLSLGPQFPNGTPEGGTAMSAASVELRQRVLANWGFVAFLDAGQVSTSGDPFAGIVRFGAGGGVRYYTPIGPIRLDVAVPLNREPGGDSFELYIGLGQAF
ncbi:MAG: autotransporter assembly complex protein TamA [Acetobacteraceae bacterium]